MAGTPPALSARLITIVETSSWSVEPLGTKACPQTYSQSRMAARVTIAKKLAARFS
jgi:hypothetical protein